MNIERIARVRSPRRGIYLAVLCTMAVLLASKGITDEGTISLNGDMPRYMMNGVYFYDVMRDLPLTNLVDYTRRYFAQYPALSLGHHPVLTSIVEVPFYAVFGISVASARLTTILFFVLAVIAWFLLAEWMYNSHIAFLSALLLVTSRLMVEFSRIVMSEIPALALGIVSAYFLVLLCESDDKKYKLSFILSFTLACYAKQLIIFLLPVFFAYVVIGKGVKGLRDKGLVSTFLAIGILLAPLVVMTLHFSPSNVGFVMGQPLSRKLDPSKLLYYVEVLWKHQISLPAVGLSSLAIGVALFRRDLRSAFFLLWIVATYGMLVCLGLETPRLAIYWIPAFCIFASLSVAIVKSPLWRVSATGLLAMIVAYQFVRAYTSEPQYTAAYEDAAAYVVENRKGATVLFSSNVDSGYFIFFVRKNDPSRQMVVLRANKVLATSEFNRIVEEKVSDPSEIYQVLRNNGTCYVVLENRPYESRPQEWLREEVRSNKFLLRHEVPFRSNDPRFQGVSLEIYEYKDCAPPDPDATLDLSIPLIGDSIQVKLADIVHSSAE